MIKDNKRMGENLVHYYAQNFPYIQGQERFVPDAVKGIQYLYYSKKREESTPM